MTQRFEWDEIKAAQNLGKHGVSFDDAASVFSNNLSYTFPDPDYSAGKYRMLKFGFSLAGRLLAVSHAERGRTIRIISARAATRHESKIDEQA